MNDCAFRRLSCEEDGTLISQKAVGQIKHLESTSSELSRPSSDHPRSCFPGFSSIRRNPCTFVQGQRTLQLGWVLVRQVHIYRHCEQSCSHYKAIYIRGKMNRNKSIPFEVDISALTRVLVDYRVIKFLTDVAVGLRFSPLIPLLKKENLEKTTYQRKTQHLVTHQTL